MNAEELEALALRLDACSRARLAQRLLESLEELSPEDNEKVWAEEARCRNLEWDTPGVARDAGSVFREARNRLG